MPILLHAQNTNTHKTLTKQGNGTKEGAGLIPRSLNDILLQTAGMKKQGWNFSIDLTFVEIYNETIQVCSRHTTRERAQNNHLVSIRHDVERRLLVQIL